MNVYFQTIILGFKVTANIRCFNRYVKTTRKYLQVKQNQRFINVNFKTNNRMFASDIKLTFYERLVLIYNLNFQSDSK